MLPPNFKLRSAARTACSAVMWSCGLLLLLIIVAMVANDSSWAAHVHLPFGEYADSNIWLKDGSLTWDWATPGDGEPSSLHCQQCWTGMTWSSLLDFDWLYYDMGNLKELIVDYGTVAFVGLLGFVLAAALRFALRRRGASYGCQNCGYDLTGNATGRCPECGATISNGTQRNSNAATQRKNPARFDIISCLSFIGSIWAASYAAALYPVLAAWLLFALITRRVRTHRERLALIFAVTIVATLPIIGWVAYAGDVSGNAYFGVAPVKYRQPPRELFIGPVNFIARLDWGAQPWPELRRRGNDWDLDVPLWPLAFMLWGIALWYCRAGARRTALQQSGHCACGYDLTGNVSGRCPECGKPVPDPAQEPSEQDTVDTPAEQSV